MEGHKEDMLYVPIMVGTKRLCTVACYWRTALKLTTQNLITKAVNNPALPSDSKNENKNYLVDQKLFRF
jgi:hypothetical protein